MSLWSRIERRLTELADDLLPDEFRHQVAEARELIDRGEAEGAVEILVPLIAERPDHVAALTLLGGAHLTLKEYEAARDAFDAGLVDRVYAFVAPSIIGGDGPSAVGGAGISEMVDVRRLREVRIERFGEDVLVVGDL